MEKKRKTLKYLTLADAFLLLKNRVIEENLTLEELSKNTGVSEDRLNFYLNSEMSDEFSRLMDFMRIGLHAKKFKYFVYKIYDGGTIGGTQVKITRVIEPKCHIYFDRKTQSFYRFNLKYTRHNKITDDYKQLIMNEMKDYLEEYENNLQEKL